MTGGNEQPDQPREPPPTDVHFVAAGDADEHGKVMTGGDLRPGTLLAAYRSGLFPMRDNQSQLGWWSPDPRGVLLTDALSVTKSLRRSERRYDVTVDACFDQVMAGCAERTSDEYEWITPEIRTAFSELHQLGWAHSIETWRTTDDHVELVGGLYGVAVGGLFSGESMFHRAPDASKVALVKLVNILGSDGYGADRIIDVQWLTPHMASLGAISMPRDAYLSNRKRVLAACRSPSSACTPTEPAQRRAQEPINLI